MYVASSFLGLFSLFNSPVLSLLSLLRFSPLFVFSLTLTFERTLTTLFFQFSRTYAVTCVVKHGFFAYFRDGERNPRKVLTLQDASIRAVEGKELAKSKTKLKKSEEEKHHMYLGVLNYHRKFIVNHPSVLKEWAKVLRLNSALRKCKSFFSSSPFLFLSFSLSLFSSLPLSHSLFDLSLLTLPLAQLHRFHSFAPVRSRTSARWFVDGKDYFQDLALQGFPSAKNHIFIADWWLVPELQLIRCPEQTENPFPSEYRLENILKRKASEGVKINILLWQETTVAGWYLASAKVKERLGMTSLALSLPPLPPLSPSSSYPMTLLEKMSPNIKVLLHPWIFPIKWSHHQKIVVIDHTTAYLGGIDLCFGRYDDGTHSLVDDQEK
jgi:hypothetical protein